MNASNTWLHRLRLQHLRLLRTLAENGSLTRTAEIAHTTQPGLSKWLKDLERDVGAPLFTRHARGLRPTDHGRLMLGHAERILNEVERTAHDLDAMREGHPLSLVIGTSPAAAPTLVPRALLDFRQRYPRARLQVFEGTMDALLTRIGNGELDAVVGRLDTYTLPPHLRYESLCEEPICMVARPNHPLAARRKLKWSDLYAYDWIVWPPGAPIRSKLDAALIRAGLEHPPYRIESASQVATLILLQDSDMISVASLHVALRYAASGLLAPLALNVGVQGSLGMCWHEDAPRESAVPELLACLRRAAAQAGAPAPHQRPWRKSG